MNNDKTANLGQEDQNLNTIQDGALENLKQAVLGLSRADISDYVIIGGWCPYLNRRDKYHPGTIDVDILFKDAFTPYYLKTYIEEMRSAGYFTSAKHQFQLLNVFNVDHLRLCYNIDLLHTAISEQSSELFVDQLDLNIAMSSEELKTIKMKSIVQKESKIIFDEKLYKMTVVTNGLEANIVSFTGMFITKLLSCQKDKRDRDSYDIFLGFETGQIDKATLYGIKSRSQVVEEQLNNFIEFLKQPKSSEVFNRRVKNFRADIDIDPAKFILKKLSLLSKR